MSEENTKLGNIKTAEDGSIVISVDTKELLKKKEKKYDPNIDPVYAGGKTPPP